MIRFVSSALLILLAATTSASVILVPDNASTIQAAIDLAASGDTILVAAGVYQENIEIIDKGIVLRGIDGRDQTFLEPAVDTLPILCCDGGKVNATTIEGLTFRNGGFGRGVVLQNCRVLFRGNALTDCKSSQSGAGLYIWRLHGEISNNLFHDDSSGTYGGGVFLYQTSNDTLSFDHNRLYANYAERGSALFVQYGQSSSNVDHNLFHDNTGAEGAGAYAGNFSAMRFDNNTFVRNDDALRIQAYHRTMWHNIVAFNRGAPVIANVHYGGLFVSCFYHNGEPYDDNSGDNVFEDPLFVDTAAGDFSLKLASPCVNPKTGFWAFTDSDGSPEDIGAFTYDLSLPIAVRPRFRNATAEHTVSHEPILSWDYLDTFVSNLQAFEIEVGTERDPFVATHWQTGELPAADSLTPYAGVPLEDGQDYVYRVRLRSETQLGDWIYLSVHMNVAPDVPTPVTPINDQIVSAASVQLRVDSVFDSDSDFVLYDFDLYDDYGDSLLITSIRNHPSPNSPPFENLLADRQYGWRAQASDGWEHGHWSALQTFRTQSGPRVVAVPAEFTSIQAALDVLSTGDTIKLSPGIHGGAANRELNFYGKQVVVMSSAGAQWTTVDLGGSSGNPHRLLPADYRPELRPVFLDLTISGGYADSGGVVKNSDVRFEDCVLKDNRADYGAVASGMNGTVSLVGSRVENNIATELGGVFYLAKGIAENCVFKANQAPSGGVASRSNCVYSGCTFEENMADQGSCFYYDDAELSYCLLLENGPGSLARYGPFHFDHCTIVHNAGVVSWVDYYWAEGATFTNCIIADNDSCANQCDLDPDNGFHPEAATATYCDIYGNKNNYSSCLSDDASRPTNISLDPLFCDAANDNFHLQAGSPCLGTGEDGTNIGAFGAGCTPTDVDDPDEGSLPKTFALSQNYPNPFNPSTQISFELPVQSDVRLTVFNILGQQVAVLVDRTLPAGTHRAIWDGRNAGGGSVSSGVYFYRLTTEAWTQSRKMLLLK